MKLALSHCQLKLYTPGEWPKSGQKEGKIILKSRVVWQLVPQSDAWQEGIPEGLIANITLVNVYVDLVVFTRIVGTS